MKLAHLLTCCAVLAGLATAPSRAHAQPAAAPTTAAPSIGAPSIGAPSIAAPNIDAPNIAGNENMPWNKGVPQDVRTTAREAFLEGNRLFKIPLFSRAVEKYAEAIDKWKHPAFYFNLAIAQINLAQWLEARDNLERAMKYGPEPLRADRFDEAKKQLIEVEHHLGRIRVSSPTPGAEVTLDGVALLTGPGQREVWVTAQPHEVTAKKPEYATQARQVAVAPGAQQAVELSLRKLVEDRPWATWKPWLVVGTGIAVAAAAGVVHGFSAHEFSAFDAGFAKLPCAATGCSQQQIDQGDPHLSSRLSRAKLEQRVAVGGYIAGGAIIAAGAALVYMNRPHLMEREDTAPGSVAVVPVVSGDSFGVAVTVRR